MFGPRPIRLSLSPRAARVHSAQLYTETNSQLSVTRRVHRMSRRSTWYCNQVTLVVTLNETPGRFYRSAMMSQESTFRVQICTLLPFRRAARFSELLASAIIIFLYDGSLHFWQIVSNFTHLDVMGVAGAIRGCPKIMAERGQRKPFPSQKK